MTLYFERKIIEGGYDKVELKILRKDKLKQLTVPFNGGVVTFPDGYMIVVFMPIWKKQCFGR